MSLRGLAEEPAGEAPRRLGPAAIRRVAANFRRMIAEEQEEEEERSGAPELRALPG